MSENRGHPVTPRTKAGENLPRQACARVSAPPRGRGFVLGAVFTVALLSACANQRQAGPYMPITGAQRDTQRAEQLCDEAVALMPKDPAAAEKKLEEALTADLYHGPAHNNLGVLYLKQGKLYEAAGEFEWARKLLPGHPDPRYNLALVLEKAGRVEEAIETYDAALAVQSGHMPSIQGLTRVIIRHDRPDQRLDGLLTDISMRGETEQWRAWARRQVVMRSEPSEG